MMRFRCFSKQLRRGLNWRKVIMHYPSYVDGLNHRGIVLSQAGNSLTAKKEFNDAIRLKPNYAEAHYNLALALHQQGNEADSRSELEKAYEIAPSLRDAPRP